MSFNYLFICDSCNKRVEQQKELTFSFFDKDKNPTVFVKDDGWECYPDGWEYKNNKTLCNKCKELEK